MQFITLGDFDCCPQYLFNACGKRRAGIATISQHVFDSRKIALVAIKSLQRALAVCEVRRSDVNGVWQTVGIHTNMTLDAGNQFAAVKSFIFGCVRVLYALCVDNKKTGCRLPSETSSDLANHIFLKLLPTG